MHCESLSSENALLRNSRSERFVLDETLEKCAGYYIRLALPWLTVCVSSSCATAPMAATMTTIPATIVAAIVAAAHTAVVLTQGHRAGRAVDC